MVEALTTEGLCSALSTFAELLKEHRETLDRLNVYPVPDGDTGTNMALTLQTVVEEMLGAEAPSEDQAVVHQATCAAVGKGAVLGARGNSGVIMGQLLRAWANTLADEPQADAALLASGLVAGSRAADEAVHTPVEGTILSVARAAAQAADEAVGDTVSTAEVLRAARDAGQVALEATPQQLPALAQAGVVDAGAAGYLLFIDALGMVLVGWTRPEQLDLPADVWESLTTAGDGLGPSTGTAGAESTMAAGGHVTTARPELGPRYEVMYLLDADDAEMAGFRQAWGDIGESIVVVGGDGLWNCHIHTDQIGAAVEAGIAAGRPHRIAVTDLHEQVGHIESDFVQEVTGGSHAQAKPTRPDGRGQVDALCSVVAVSPATGTDALFHAAGAAQLVSGGQTMNPSTAELLSAVEATGTANVVVLPNNSNIVAEAEMLDELTDLSVCVVATKSVISGLSAMVAFDPELDAAANAEAMREASSEVRFAEVTRAVRDTELARTEAAEPDQVRAGEWIGLLEGKAGGIVAHADGQREAAVATLGELVDDSIELVTVLTGADAEPDTVTALQNWLAEHHPEVDCEVLAGGQPHYPFQFGAE